MYQTSAVAITDEMKARAKKESKKRDPHIEHHFEVPHFTGLERDIVGFLGEFACCEYFGLNWRDNIRENYLTIDNGDINGRFRIDVKTETIPASHFTKVWERRIKDDELYGRRLINADQMGLLHKYEVVAFGALIREQRDRWYPLGYLETAHILQRYEPTDVRPDGGRYPTKCLPVRTSELKPIDELKALFMRR